MRRPQCTPVWGSCNKRAGHKGLHDAYKKLRPLKKKQQAKEEM